MIELIEQEIENVINNSEEPLTGDGVKRELMQRAVKKAYGVTSFNIGMIRRALQNLVDQKRIENDPKEVVINQFKKVE